MWFDYDLDYRKVTRVEGQMQREQEVVLAPDFKGRLSRQRLNLVLD